LIIKYDHLLGIRSGKISLAFRRWDKPNVKKDGTMKTAMGVIRIEDVEVVDQKKISTKDAIGAGFESVEELMNSLRKTDDAIYKVKLRYESADPRIELRSQTLLTDADFQKLRNKLDRLDKTKGPWVSKTLLLIEKHPHRRAGDLADIIGMERLEFKLNVRKLKNLGLTISHDVGYSISPFGKIIMQRL
jgi:hypothetical protein